MQRSRLVYNVQLKPYISVQIYLHAKFLHPTSHIFLKEVKKFRMASHNNLFLKLVPDQCHIEHVRTNNQNNKITK